MSLSEKLLNLEDNKVWSECNLLEHPQMFREEQLDGASIEVKVLENLSKDLGLSYNLYSSICSLDEQLADRLVSTMVLKTGHSSVSFLRDVESNKILGYTLDSSRTPISNYEFLYRLNSQVEASSDVVSIEEYYISEEDNISTVLISRNDPIEIKSAHSEGKYKVGVLFVNDEFSNTYCRLVVYIGGQPLYLPASYYNTSSSRYRRTTSDSKESLDVMILKVIDDLRSDVLYNKIYDMHFRYRANKELVASYEEYSELLNNFLRIPTVVEDRGLADPIILRRGDFEEKYDSLDEHTSSYLWRCTATSENTIGSLLELTTSLLNDIKAPNIEYFRIREILGSYVGTQRVASEIAKEDK